MTTLQFSDSTKEYLGCVLSIKEIEKTVCETTGGTFGRNETTAEELESFIEILNTAQDKIFSWLKSSIINDIETKTG